MLADLLRTMRPRQWLKNGFVFIALFFDRQLDEPTSILYALAAFVLLCLMSGAVYIMNDLGDMENDRQHPRKRTRPLASGRLNPNVATVAAIILAAGSLIAGLLLSFPFGVILLAYLLTQIAYTLWLKHEVLIDVSVVATGFILRIAAGVAVLEPVQKVQRFSPWLYVFGGFLALFLALGKRRHEMVLLGADAGNHRAILREYNLELLDKLIGIVTTSTLVSYSLYTFLAEGLPENHLMMLTIPFVLYGLFRYLYLVHVRHEGGAPEEILLRDRPLQVTVGLWGLIVLIALYLAPGTG